MNIQQQEASTANPGLIAGVAAIGKNFLALLHNRLELAALEFSEVRTNLVKLLVLVAVGLLATWFAILYWSVVAVYIFWDALGWKILLLVAALFTGLAGGMFWYARSLLANGKLSMPATLSELRNDRDALL
ncbi:hypothetical protein BH11PSE11_BH11PSE11_18770 [soil metagenome]